MRMTIVAGEGIGNELRMARMTQGRNLAEVAGAVGITASYLSMIESGRRFPRDSGLLQRIRDALGLGTAPAHPSPAPDPADAERLLEGAWDAFYGGNTAMGIQLLDVATRPFRTSGQNQASRIVARCNQARAVFTRDAGDLQAALTYAIAATSMAREIGDIDILAAALFRQSRVYDALSNTDSALVLAREAVSYAPRVRNPLRGYLHQHLADLASRHHALDAGQVDRLMNTARHNLRYTSGSDGSFTTLSQSGLAHDGALIAIRRREPLPRCLELISQARAVTPLRTGRWRVGLHCTEVLAYSVHGDVESAHTLAMEVIRDAQLSSNHLGRLRAAARLLQEAHPQHPRVRSFLASIQ